MLFAIGATEAFERAGKIMEATSQLDTTPPIFIVSGGAGALGKHVARVVLAQFPGVAPEVIVIPQICHAEQLSEVVAQVAARRGTIIHTMVDSKTRETLVSLARGHLRHHLAQLLGMAELW